jgi:hypothetical protein
VVGHATSPDLRQWTLQPPLTAPEDSGFGQLEVMQVETIDHQPVLLFSCLSEHATQARQTTTKTGGIWAAPPTRCSVRSGSPTPTSSPTTGSTWAAWSAIATPGNG